MLHGCSIGILSSLSPKLSSFHSSQAGILYFVWTPHQWVSLFKYLQKNLSLGNLLLTHFSPARFPPSLVSCCNPSIMVVMDILSVFSSGVKKSWGLYISVPHKWLRFDWECLQLNTPNIKLHISLFFSCFSSCR